ncbi:MAG: NADAR family protein [Ignavibacteriales bacterium]|nr:NADAR family protein [Ignavibacteriales bacterium]
MQKLKGIILGPEEVTITKVKDPGGWLSNMSPHPIQHDGKIFRTAEALFQWLRFSNHPGVQSTILEQKSPMGAKMKARKNRNLLGRGEKWDEALDDIPRMKECLILKLEQHPDLKQRLIETGDAIIIEDCTTHDRESARFWGSVKVDGTWVGENKLGKLWMEIRDEIVASKNDGYLQLCRAILYGSSVSE